MPDGSGSVDQVLTKTKGCTPPLYLKRVVTTQVSTPAPRKCILALCQQRAPLVTYSCLYATLGPSSGTWSVKKMVSPQVNLREPLTLSWEWDSKATPKVLKLHRSFNELSLLLGSSFSKYLISDFPSAPGISCTGAADCFTSYQAALLSVFTLPTFRWALLTRVLPAFSQPSGSHTGICSIPRLLEFLIVGGHMLASTLSFWLFILPPSCPVPSHWLFFLQRSFYSCWEICALMLPVCLCIFCPLCPCLPRAPQLPRHHFYAFSDLPGRSSIWPQEMHWHSRSEPEDIITLLLTSLSRRVKDGNLPRKGS